MKLKVDFTELVRLGRVMMPEGSDFSLNRLALGFEPIDIALSSGKDVEIGELDSGITLLSYQGRQVLLYIKDHTGKFDAALVNGEQGNRFHIAHCSTLETMKNHDRYQRYVATNRLDGRFLIEDAASWGGVPRSGEAALKVCKNCLLKLNYRSYTSHAVRQNVFAAFSLTNFFSHYSTCFKYMPKDLSDRASIGYSPDWPELSKHVREAAGYRCDECFIDLSAHKKLCDVHHINGVKSDNAPSNLRVLCKDCHRKQPRHGGIFLSSRDMEIIRALRSRHGVLDNLQWDGVYQLTDTSVHGDIAVLQNKGFPVPVAGFDVLNAKGEVHATLEVAWPDRRIAVNLTKIDLPGWQVYQVGEICGGLG